LQKTNLNTQIPEEEKEGEKDKNKSTFDYSKIDYNKYIDSLYNPKKVGGRQNKNHNMYDKNAVNENVNQYYESFYEEK
jgi:hypothetical protein